MGLNTSQGESPQPKSNPSRAVGESPVSHLAASPLEKASLPPVPSGTTPAGAALPEGTSAANGGSTAPGGSGTLPGESEFAKKRSEFFAKVGSKIDLDEWIKMSGLRAQPGKEQSPIFSSELDKIRQLGVWKDPEGSGNVTGNVISQMLRAVPMKFCRGVMGASWAGTVVAIGVLAAAAPVWLVVYGPTILALNWGVQKLCGWLHNQKFKSVFDELKRETRGAGSLEAGIAWAGVMHEFLDRHNPIFFGANQTVLGNFHDMTSLDAVKRQLRQAAQYAAQKLGTDSQVAVPYYKDHFFDDMLAQNNAALEAFEKRCLDFPTKSALYANPLPLLKKFWFGK